MKLSIYLYHCLTDENSRGRSVVFELNEKPQELENAKFHLLLLTHKFPIQQKFQGDLANGSNMFAQAIVMPWDLLLDGPDRDAVMIVAPSGHDKVPLENLARHEDHLMQKRRKNDQLPNEVSNCGLNDAQNGLRGSCSFCSSSYTKNTCVVVTKGVNFHYTGVLICANEHTESVCSCKLPMRKVLLEFDPDSSSKYEVAKIGCCYLITHQDGDTLCSIKENYQVTRAKVNICSGTFLRRLTFSSIESFHCSHLSNPFPCLSNNGVDSNIFSDINMFVPSGALKLLEKFTKAWDGGLSGTNYCLEEMDIDNPVRSVKDASKQSLGISCSNYPLPEGNLVTINGLVVALHECNVDAFPAQDKRITAEKVYMQTLLHVNGGGVCVHVLVDNRMVRIVGDLGKQTHPTGLGKGTHATFHRILVLSGQNKYMMTPVSFITIKETHLTNEVAADEESDTCKPLGLISVPLKKLIHTSLICDVFQMLEPKLMQFRCRVVAVYVLVVEKAGTSAVTQSSPSAISIQSAFGIPFAGFVIDDGSSCCCCWADCERAAMLLGLEPKEYLLETFGTRSQYKSTMKQLKWMSEKHGRVVVKHNGSLFDSSCQDLSFSGLIGSSDEDLLRSLIASAVSSMSWSIEGSVMDSKVCSWLEEQLSGVDVAVPTLQNMWVTSVGRTGVLEEARNVIRELIL